MSRAGPPHHSKPLVSCRKENGKERTDAGSYDPVPYSSTNAEGCAHLVERGCVVPGSLPKFEALAVERDLEEKKGSPFGRGGRLMATVGRPNASRVLERDS